MTFFDTAKRSFADVPLQGNEIPTTEFLEASETVVALFDVLGSAAFMPVQKDMTGNIKKIRERQLAHPETSGTLQQLTQSELASGSHTASEGLLWLNRGLEFTSQALRKNLDNQSEELAASFTNAYGETLKKHHNFVVKGIFGVAMKACPYRDDFYKKLGGDDVTKTQAQMQDWVKALEGIVSILATHLETVKW